MTEFTKRLIIVVTLGQQIAANAKAKEVDLEGGERTFTAGLSPTGALPVTHLWCNWQMKPAERDGIKQRLEGIPGIVQLFELSSFDPLTAKPTAAEILRITVPPLKTLNEAN